MNPVPALLEAIVALEHAVGVVAARGDEKLARRYAIAVERQAFKPEPVELVGWL